MWLLQQHPEFLFLRLGQSGLVKSAKLYSEIKTKGKKSVNAERNPGTQL